MIIDSEAFNTVPKNDKEREMLLAIIEAETEVAAESLAEVAEATQKSMQRSMDTSAMAQLSTLMDREPRRYDHGEPEAKMTRRQLYKIARYAQEVHDALRDEDNLPEWVQSKVAVMDANIGSVKHFLEYRDARGDY